ncbi:hypothetical protein GCM10023149_08480 [Mucilaginibacter gynuensis]|uniref:DUF4270 family protein n=1 Tax=Mucilaginibacter gynuensis TaxID=1302236 RepID=A0ABP8FXD0_9SPHI
MKIKPIVLLSFLTAALFAGCKKDVKMSPEYAQSYFRFIVIDAPGGGKIQFAMDGLTNANGDSVVHNPDGSIYQEDPNQPSTVTVNYPSGGWSDNTPLNFAGVYGYYFTDGSRFSYFPNPTNRIMLAPNINKFNFFNWASLPAAQHTISLYGVVTANQYGNMVSVRGPKFYERQVNLEGGAIQTSLLVNKSSVKAYTTAGQNTENGFPYGMSETISFNSQDMDIISFKDHPDKFQQFKDTCAYVRFINFTPVYNDQVLNQNTDSIDVYLAPMYGPRADYFDPSYRFTVRFITKIGQEFLAAKGLGRFQTKDDQPFTEIPLGRYMRINPQTNAPDTVGLPRYFRVLAYKAGESAATGAAPLGVGDWLPVYNSFGLYNRTYRDSFLLRYDGKSYHPTVATIPVAVGPTKVPVTQSSTEAYNYLGYRSVISYIPVGVNSFYYAR